MEVSNNVLRHFSEKKKKKELHSSSPPQPHRRNIQSGIHFKDFSRFFIPRLTSFKNQKNPSKKIPISTCHNTQKAKEYVRHSMHISFTSETQISKKLTKPMPINQLLEESSPRERETNIDTRSASFLSPACQQSVGLIKIHQTPIGYKPISLICSKTKTTITTG